MNSWLMLSTRPSSTTTTFFRVFAVVDSLNGIEFLALGIHKASI